MGRSWDDSDEECSVIGDKGEIGFIDYGDERSVCSYNPEEEGPLTISVPFPFVDGKPQSILVGKTTTEMMTIKNTTDEPVSLWASKIFSSSPEDSYTLSVMEPPSDDADEETIRGFLESCSLEERTIQPHGTLRIWLSCTPKEIGLHTTIVHFDADDERVERVVFLLADDMISRSLVSKKPFLRAPRRKHFEVTEFVPGSRPVKAPVHGFKYRLPKYEIPIDLRQLLESKQMPQVILNGLSRENYASFFSVLIIMEELKLEEEMKNHDMEQVSMQKKGSFLALVVPGLAERRPSLVHGDFVFAKLTSDNHDESIQPYQGFIHRVEADAVFLSFAKEFHLSHRDENLYSIRFTYNRVNMRRLYQAVEAAKKLETDLLFPSTSKRKIRRTPIVPLTQNLNEEQKSSIEMILGCTGAPPYAIHGPPGTGKTKTLVEAILQLYKTKKNARILICASSNSASDHVLEKLISKDFEIQESEVFRLNATSRPYEDVQPDHLCFCYFVESVFKCPPIRALLRYRIIICTYMSASLLYAEGIKRGHFSHIFLDEAGQASEPETMIPISNLCKKETVVVLAGDPKQLGPIVYSKNAEIYGLGRSYLERLFEFEAYCNGDENYVTKLVKNYRSHPVILKLPSEIFYKGELIACNEGKSAIDDWKVIIPNKEFPLFFIGIQGCDEREGHNPSWFNRIEASKVIEIIRKLNAKTDISDADIGVITPYRQQVLKLKKALEDTLDMPDVKVGSVEQFQGQEREVMIISTVRSTIKHNEFDRLHYLGFLSNPRRFNVAVTRAKSLLIIVGNPHIISKDPYWEKILWYCSENNSYQGCPLPEKHTFTDENKEDPQIGNEGKQGNYSFEGKQGDEGSFEENWGKNSLKGKWGENSLNGNCGDGSFEAQEPVANEGYEAKWPDHPNPINDSEGGWSDHRKPFGNERSDPGWSDFRQPVTCESYQAGWSDIPAPVTDEAEWSDGWKS
ncbi:hypothetical protein Syun_029287 [Stephania yunnanensis]|uniref:RNA helicase n=1 Tax=Stephania yunnanensis TaxID=152371 RepID=A0AAP0HFW0_9MAGN